MLPTLPDLTGTAQPTCAVDESTLCARVWDLTHKRWLAESSNWLIAKPATILAIVLVALLLRWLVHRAIRRVAQSTATVGVPPALAPLHDRAPTLADATGLASERREQRARAIGSILSSIASAVIFAIALMEILDVLTINLAPVLASAGIAGVAIGFGAQSLVKDVLAGIFMLLEDQYGVGDVIDVGEASGTVEAVGLRITTLRDANGVVWHVRNGEVIRVGNKSQGWAVVNVDIPLPFGTPVEQASTVVGAAAAELADDPGWRSDLLDRPEVLGVEQMTTTGMLLRITVQTTSSAQWRVARELRARINAALEAADISYGLPAGAPTAGNTDQKA